jgi:hypothetical protein
MLGDDLGQRRLDAEAFANPEPSETRSRTAAMRLTECVTLNVVGAKLRFVASQRMHRSAAPSYGAALLVAGHGLRRAIGSASVEPSQYIGNAIADAAGAEPQDAWAFV